MAEQQTPEEIASDRAWDEAVKINTDWHRYAATLTPVGDTA